MLAIAKILNAEMGGYGCEMNIHDLIEVPFSPLKLHFDKSTIRSSTLSKVSNLSLRASRIA